MSKTNDKRKIGEGDRRPSQRLGLSGSVVLEDLGDVAGAPLGPLPANWNPYALEQQITVDDPNDDGTGGVIDDVGSSSRQMMVTPGTSVSASDVAKKYNALGRKNWRDELAAENPEIADLDAIQADRINIPDKWARYLSGAVGDAAATLRYITGQRGAHLGEALEAAIEGAVAELPEGGVAGLAHGVNVDLGALVEGMTEAQVAHVEAAESVGNVATDLLTGADFTLDQVQAALSHGETGESVGDVDAARVFSAIFSGGASEAIRAAQDASKPAPAPAPKKNTHDAGLDVRLTPAQAQKFGLRVGQNITPAQSIAIKKALAGGQHSVSGAELDELHGIGDQIFAGFAKAAGAVTNVFVPGAGTLLDQGAEAIKAQVDKSTGHDPQGGKNPVSALPGQAGKPAAPPPAGAPPAPPGAPAPAPRVPVEGSTRGLSGKKQIFIDGAWVANPAGLDMRMPGGPAAAAAAYRAAKAKPADKPADKPAADTADKTSGRIDGAMGKTKDDLGMAHAALMTVWKLIAAGVLGAGAGFVARPMIDKARAHGTTTNTPAATPAKVSGLDAIAGVLTPTQIATIKTGHADQLGYVQILQNADVTREQARTILERAGGSDDLGLAPLAAAVVAGGVSGFIGGIISAVMEPFIAKRMRGGAASGAPQLPPASGTPAKVSGADSDVGAHPLVAWVSTRGGGRVIWNGQRFVPNPNDRRPVGFAFVFQAGDGPGGTGKARTWYATNAAGALLSPLSPQPPAPVPTSYSGGSTAPGATGVAFVWNAGDGPGGTGKARTWYAVNAAGKLLAALTPQPPAPAAQQSAKGYPVTTYGKAPGAAVADDDADTDTTDDAADDTDDTSDDTSDDATDADVSGLGAAKPGAKTSAKHGSVHGSAPARQYAHHGALLHEHHVKSPLGLHALPKKVRNVVQKGQPKTPRAGVHGHDDIGGPQNDPATGFPSGVMPGNRGNVVDAWPTAMPLEAFDLLQELQGQLGDLEGADGEGTGFVPFGGGGMVTSPMTYGRRGRWRRGRRYGQQNTAALQNCYDQIQSIRAALADCQSQGGDEDDMGGQIAGLDELVKAIGIDDLGSTEPEVIVDDGLGEALAEHHTVGQIGASEWVVTKGGEHLIELGSFDSLAGALGATVMANLVDVIGADDLGSGPTAARLKCMQKAAAAVGKSAWAKLSTAKREAIVQACLHKAGVHGVEGEGDMGEASAAGPGVVDYPAVRTKAVDAMVATIKDLDASTRAMNLLPAVLGKLEGQGIYFATTAIPTGYVDALADLDASREGQSVQSFVKAAGGGVKVYKLGAEVPLAKDCVCPKCDAAVAQGKGEQPCPKGCTVLGQLASADAEASVGCGCAAGNLGGPPVCKPGQKKTIGGMLMVCGKNRKWTFSSAQKARGTAYGLKDCRRKLAIANRRIAAIKGAPNQGVLAQQLRDQIADLQSQLDDARSQAQDLPDDNADTSDADYGTDTDSGGDDMDGIVEGADNAGWATSFAGYDISIVKNALKASAQKATNELDKLKVELDKISKDAPLKPGSPSATVTAKVSGETIQGGLAASTEGTEETMSGENDNTGALPGVNLTVQARRIAYVRSVFGRAPDSPKIHVSKQPALDVKLQQGLGRYYYNVLVAWAFGVAQTAAKWKVAALAVPRLRSKVRALTRQLSACQQRPVPVDYGYDPSADFSGYADMPDTDYSDEGDDDDDTSGVDGELEGFGLDGETVEGETVEGDGVDGLGDAEVGAAALQLEHAKRKHAEAVAKKEGRTIRTDRRVIKREVKQVKGLRGEVNRLRAELAACKSHIDKGTASPEHHHRHSMIPALILAIEATIHAVERSNHSLARDVHGRGDGVSGAGGAAAPAAGAPASGVGGAAPATPTAGFPAGFPKDGLGFHGGGHGHHGSGRGFGGGFGGFGGGWGNYAMPAGGFDPGYSGGYDPYADYGLMGAPAAGVPAGCLPCGGGPRPLVNGGGGFAPGTPLGGFGFPSGGGDGTGN